MAIASCLTGTLDALADVLFVQDDVFCVGYLNGEVMYLRWRWPYSLSFVFFGRQYSNGESNVVQLNWDRVQVFSASHGQLCSSEVALQPDEEKVLCGAIFKDGSRIVTGWSFGAVRICDIKTNKAILWSATEGRSSGVTSVAASEGATRVVSGWGVGTVRVWDSMSGQQAGATLTGHGGPVQSVAITGNGRFLVSGSHDRTVQVWDSERGQQVEPALVEHDDTVQGVAVSRDGRRVVSGSHGESVLDWDMDSHLGVYRYAPAPPQHTDSVRSVVVSGNEQVVVSGSDDRTVRVWDAEKWQRGLGVVQTLTGHAGLVRSVVLSEDGLLVVSGSRDQTVWVWDVEGGQQGGPAHTGHEAPVRCIAVSRDGQWAVPGSRGGTVCVWDMESGQQVGDELARHWHWVQRVAVSADGRRVVSRSSNTVCLWDLEQATCVNAGKIECEDWRQRWNDLCQDFLGEREAEASGECPRKYFARGRSIIHSVGKSEKVVAFEAEISMLQLAQGQTAATALVDGMMAFLRVVERKPPLKTLPLRATYRRLPRPSD